MMGRLLHFARILLSAAVACSIAPLGRAADSAPGSLVASREAGWPQWRGPRRDGISDERGLLRSWPAGGPKLLWTADGLGQGYSSPIVSGGNVFITGDVGEALQVFALGVDNTRKWQATNGRSWKGSTPGSRSSCCLDGNRLFHLNAHGRLACLDIADGREVWAVDTLVRFEAKNIQWGISESVLVDDGKVIVTPVGAKALMAALDAATGETVWASDPIPGDEANYASPLLVQLGTRRLVLTATLLHTVAVDADSGGLLWKFPHPFVKTNVTTTPVFCRDSVVITNSGTDGVTTYCLRLDAQTAQPEKTWSSPLRNIHGSLLCVEGMLYGSHYNDPKGWVCADAATGEERYRATDLVVGSGVFADGRLYCLSEDGVMSLIEPTPTAFRTVGSFRLVPGAADAYAHPVVCGGRLYLRYRDKLYCYDVAGG